jgi:hypothetical protein
VTFERRRGNNPRYSLRAFARMLDTDHATLPAQADDTRDRRAGPKAAADA